MNNKESPNLIAKRCSNGGDFIKKMTTAPAKIKDQGSFDIKLAGAEKGKVVTRFPPEPSGYLHIGHAKAVLLNEYFARHYEGKLIVRFDDTNALKENTEYEQSILEDLELLGVKGDIYSYTSDHFSPLLDYAYKLIDLGLAYCDDSTVEVMRKNRFDGIASPRRDTSVDENRRIFGEMIKGRCLEYCLRAKMSVDHPNKALRDPVIYRCQVEVAHHRTGFTFKVYPTYDFACPIVDSNEGVTHALRTSEYNDRNDQYMWFLEKLNLRKPHIWDYARLNFVYTLLSKRKLNWFVTSGHVSGWDDPRFPTVRGILRRGLTLNSLRSYILMQGPSKNTILLEWDKLWTLNKKDIDPVSPRYTALVDTDDAPIVPVTLSDGPSVPYRQQIPLHQKNADLGTKDLTFAAKVFLSQEDALTLEDDEEVTFMKWGNVIITNIEKENGIVTSVTARLHLEGDFKLTKKKLTWLSCDFPDEEKLVEAKLHDYDFLITKKKLDEADNFEDFLTPKSEFIRKALGEPSLKSLKHKDIIQLERNGYYICDRPWSPEEPSVKLILIPDGKAKSIASKASS